MLPLETAQQRIFEALPRPSAETVPLKQALHRIVLAPIQANCDLPPFDNAAVDGFAVRSDDLVEVDSARPLSLRMIGTSSAGRSPELPLTSGTCLRIFTGAPLPAGGDAVAMQEDTYPGPIPSTVCFKASVKPWENVRFQGEDVRRRGTLAETGTRLHAGHLGLLASCGLSEIQAGVRPRVAILATGNELREPGTPLKPGQIYESNRSLLGALVTQAGGLPRVYPVVPDEPGATARALEQALGECDVLLSSGGVSVGEFDFVKSAWQEVGGRLDWWRVAIKPGRPFAFGTCKERTLFGLPGNPASALVTFILLVWPALQQWQGAVSGACPSHPVRLAEPLSNRGDRRHFLRVYVSSNGLASASGIQASHCLSSLAAGNALIDVPPQTTLPAGSLAEAIRWDF